MKIFEHHSHIFFTEKIEVLNSILLDVLINVRKKNSLKIKITQSPKGLWVFNIFLLKTTV